MRRLRELEDENDRLKRIVADRELGIQLRNKTPKRRVKAKLREDRTTAVRPNDVGRWTLSTTSWRLAASCVS